MHDKREYQGYDRLLQHPRIMPMTDCDGLTPEPDGSSKYGIPVAAYSMFVRYLVDLVVKNPVLKLEDAIYRITGLPAEALQIPQRGQLVEGNFADITMFSLGDLAYPNDFLRPNLCPEGISHVIVNGAFALKDGTYCGSGTGRVLKP